ncbi:MAG: response regulator transcription factor [Roseiflexaceae bacterium]
MDQYPHIRILIVDDQAVIRRGMEALLSKQPGIEIVGSAASGEEALAFLNQPDGMADVVLLDVDMPGIGGIATTRQIHQTWPECAVLLLTSHRQFNAAGVHAGARGYLLKSVDLDELLVAIRALARGRTYLQAWNVDNKVLVLSDIELQILDLFADGMTYSEIARRCGYSETSVKLYLKAIVSKLDANGRGHAIRIAMRLGLLR